MPNKLKIDLNALGISLSSGDIQFDFDADFIKQTANPFDPGNGPTLPPGILKILMVRSTDADITSTATVTADGISAIGSMSMPATFTTTGTGQTLVDSGSINITSTVSTSISYPIVQIDSAPTIASSFTTTSAGVSTPTELANITTARAYTENTINTNLFSSTAPTLTTGQPTLDHTVRFEITNYNNASEDGWLKDNTYSAVAGGAVKTLEFTGTKSEIDTWLASNVRYIPPPNISSQQRIDVTVLQGSLTTQTTSFYINGTADATPVTGAGVYDAWNGTSNGREITLTDEMRYFLKADVLLVGGGAYGGLCNGITPAYAAGGGGAGGILHFVNTEVFKNTNIDKIRILGGGVLNPGQQSEDSYLQDYTGNTVVSNLAIARGGGYGAEGGSNPGNAGGSGGFGGGGAGFSGLGGSAIANYLDTSMGVTNVNRYGAGNQAQSASPGGDGGGDPFTTDISGSSVTYAYPGPGGNSSTTLYTTPGSGGHGQSKTQGGVEVDARTAGQRGKIIIKFYEYS